MRRVWMVAAVAPLVIGLWATAAGAKPAPVVCGQDGTLAVSGTVTLTADLTCNFVPHGTAVVNLAGHTLTGNIDPYPTAVVRIKGGTVTGEVGFPYDPTGHTITILRATIGGGVTNNTGTTNIRLSRVGSVVLSDINGTGVFKIIDNTIDGSIDLAPPSTAPSRGASSGTRSAGQLCTAAKS